jgi:hypothetical protein
VRTVTTAPDPHPSLDRRWLVEASRAVLKRPSLWGTAIAQVARLAPKGWWRRRPWLPLPDAAYLRFRLQTAYGDPTREPEPHDLVTYLHWCRAWHHL